MHFTKAFAITFTTFATANPNVVVVKLSQGGPIHQIPFSRVFMVLLTGRSDPNSLQMRCHISTWILKKVILLFSYNQLYIYIYM